MIHRHSILLGLQRFWVLELLFFFQFKNMSSGFFGGVITGFFLLGNSIATDCNRAIVTDCKSLVTISEGTVTVCYITVTACDGTVTV